MSGIDMSAKVAPLASTTYFDKKRASSLVLRPEDLERPLHNNSHQFLLCSILALQAQQKSLPNGRLKKSAAGITFYDAAYMSYSYFSLPWLFFAYIRVVSVDACPIISHKVGSGIPLFNALVAKV